MLRLKARVRFRLLLVSTCRLLVSTFALFSRLHNLEGNTLFLLYGRVLSNNAIFMRIKDTTKEEDRKIERKGRKSNGRSCPSLSHSRTFRLISNASRGSVKVAEVCLYESGLEKGSGSRIVD